MKPHTAYIGTDRDGELVFVTIERRDRNGTPELSITGCTMRTIRSRDISSGGQITDTLDRIETYADGWTPADVVELRDIWNAWHLNTMKAGCEHQRAEGWSDRPIDPTKPTNTYGRHFPEQRQDSWNMLTWVRPDEHPDGLLTKPCPVCGYRYGTAWLHEQIPADVWRRIDRLCQLPAGNVPEVAR